VLLYRCNSTQFNPHGQLFFNPLVQSMRMIVHFGETLPESITPEHIISSSLLLLRAVTIFCGMLFCFGIGAATGDQFVVLARLSLTVLHGVEQVMWTCAYAYIHSFTCTIIGVLERSIRCLFDCHSMLFLSCNICWDLLHYQSWCWQFCFKL